jgi:hypothetical protein
MGSQRTINLTEKDIEHIVEKTIETTLIKMGVEVNNPLEMQKDLQHLRDWRRATGTIRVKGFLFVAGIIVTGALAALWVGIKHMVVQ